MSEHRPAPILSPRQVAALVLAEPAPSRLNLVLPRSAFLSRSDGRREVSLIRTGYLPFPRWPGGSAGARTAGGALVRHLTSDPRFRASHSFILTGSVVSAATIELGMRQRGLHAEIAVAPPNWPLEIASQRELAAAISTSGANLLFMALAGLQGEAFLVRNRDRLPRCWAFCIARRALLAALAWAPGTRALPLTPELTARQPAANATFAAGLARGLPF